jgi:hypothetical protein
VPERVSRGWPGGPPARPGVYVPRQTHDCDAAVLVSRHLPGFLARLEESGHGLPEFVKDELARFGVCGDFEQGFPQSQQSCRLGRTGRLIKTVGREQELKREYRSNREDRRI